MDGWMDGWMNGWMDHGWMNGRIDEWSDGSMNGWMYSTLMFIMNLLQSVLLAHFPFFLNSTFCFNTG